MLVILGVKEISTLYFKHRELIFNFVKNNIIRILKKLVRAKAIEENKARQEYILNILLVSNIFLILIGTIRIIYQLVFSKLSGYKDVSLSLFIILGLLLFLITLYLLSHYGKSRLAAYIFLTTLFIIATYMGCQWGVDLQAEILFYVLIIVMTGILVGSIPAFVVTFIISLTFFVIGELQTANIIRANRSWANEAWGYSDIMMTSIILFIIAIISWLFNHELKKSFIKLQKSEIALKEEKDLLEIRVEEKTKELKIIQAEEIAQVYRFAEFGRLSSGLFHDLVNPLTTVMLNVGKIKVDSENYPGLAFIKSELEQASKASEKMNSFISSVRKQISPQGEKKCFCLNQEIEDAISVLNYKALRNKVILNFFAKESVNTCGDSIKFNQIITNLISNAIDAYDDINIDKKEVKIILDTQKDNIIINIIDNGPGIKEENINKIFEPFFTTKIKNNNLGLGLSLIKKFIEEDFLGNIKISSRLNIETIFTVSLPLT
jgi:signal transduction histidine kinase